MQGNLNALGLIAVLLFTVFILCKFGELKPKRIIFALFAGYFAILITSIPFAYKCLAGNNPGFQGSLPALSLVLVLMFVRKKTVVWMTSIILIVAGYTLCWHFHYLIFKAGSYTGEPNYFSCSAIKETGKERSVKSWHTPLTGLYRIER